jgi:hypothetical protein
MKQEDFNNIIRNRLRQIKSLLSRKNSEYANIDDVHINFKTATGLSFHDTPQKVLWEYCVKHLQSIKDIVEGKEASYETIQEKIGDVVAYMLILETMYTPVDKYKYYDSSCDFYKYYITNTLNNSNEGSDK